MDKIKFRINGLLPQMMHNNQMADPLNIYKKACVQITSKRKRTDADELMISRIEWEAGLYFDEEGNVAWPAQNIERMLLDSAKKNKNGVKVKEGIRVLENYAMLDIGCVFKRSKKPEKQSDIPSPELDKFFVKFFDRRSAKIGGRNGGTVIRTRPRFDKWALEFTVLFNQDIINRETIIETLQIAGQQIGFSDYRPRYGLFEFEVLE